MTTHEFYEDTHQPWVRRDDNLKWFPCPACGSTTVLIGHDDVKDDNRDIDLYCDNSNCEFRNFRIIGMRTSSNAPRADVAALLAVDNGTPMEQHTAGILGRRQRETDIVVKPT